jgi:hypothetical protein
VLTSLVNQTIDQLRKKLINNTAGWWIFSQPFWSAKTMEMLTFGQPKSGGIFGKPKLQVDQSFHSLMSHGSLTQDLISQGTISHSSINLAQNYMALKMGQMLKMAQIFFIT